MIISYSDPKFKERRLARIKLHTIREDIHDRWYAGRKVHEWLYNPRNVSKNPHEFNQTECVSTQLIKFLPGRLVAVLPVNKADNALNKGLWRILTAKEVSRLAVGDGFSGYDDFWEWFGQYSGKRPLKIIHFTLLEY